jgi:hypothetical protein
LNLAEVVAQFQEKSFWNLGVVLQVVAGQMVRETKNCEKSKMFQQRQVRETGMEHKKSPADLLGRRAF